MNLRPLIEFMVHERRLARRDDKLARAARIEAALSEAGIEIVELADRTVWARGSQAGMVRLDG